MSCTPTEQMHAARQAPHADLTYSVTPLHTHIQCDTIAQARCIMLTSKSCGRSSCSAAYAASARAHFSFEAPPSDHAAVASAVRRDTCGLLRKRGTAVGVSTLVLTCCTSAGGGYGARAAREATGCQWYQRSHMTNEGSGSSSPMTLMSLQHSHNPHAFKCNMVCYCCHLFVLLTLKQSAYLMELDTLGATLCGSEECATSTSPASARTCTGLLTTGSFS